MKTYRIPGYKRPKGLATVNTQVLNETIMEERALGLLAGLTLACNALRDMPDPYGPKRMHEFLHRVAVKMNCVAEGYVSSRDLMDILIDEVGIDLRDTEIRKAMPGLVEYGRKHEF